MTQWHCRRKTKVHVSCSAAAHSELHFGDGQGARAQHAPSEAAARDAPYGAQPAASAGRAFEAAAECGGVFGGRQTAPGVNVILHEELALGALIGEGGFGKVRAGAAGGALHRSQRLYSCPLDQTVLQ